ncbi:MAG: hypothetical protein H8K04_18455 [Nitrospira sp.]
MNDIETILQWPDMETSRTPQELYDWVNSKSSELSETAEGKRYARSGALLPKKLWDEIRPLGLFAYCLYGQRTDVKCTPSLTNDNYDGRIDFCDSSMPSIYVEVTYAKDGYEEHLRLEVLTAKGSVNALGKVSKSGTKASGNRTVEVENEAVKHDETRSKALEIVKTRIHGKSGKQYGPNHVLVIVVDDYLAFRRENDRVVLVEFVKPIVKSVQLDFRAVFVLGATGNYLDCVYGEL